MRKGNPRFFFIFLSRAMNLFAFLPAADIIADIFLHYFVLYSLTEYYQNPQKPIKPKINPTTKKRTPKATNPNPHTTAEKQTEPTAQASPNSRFAAEVRKDTPELPKPKHSPQPSALRIVDGAPTFSNNCLA